MTPIEGVSDIRRMPRLGKVRLGIKVEPEGKNPYPRATDYFVVPDEIKGKSMGIRQQIQSLLSNPLHYLGQLCNLSITFLILKSQLLKYQPRHFCPAGILLALSWRGRGYNCITDNGKETIPLAAPPTLQETTPRSADETDMMAAPSTLPESVTEVVLC